MSPKTIVQTLGGALYDHGRRANIPAPGHSSLDRSVSLLLEDNRIVVHTFGDGNWRSVLDHLRRHRLIDTDNAPLSLGTRADAAGSPPPASQPERRAAAKALWDRGRALRQTLSERHCRVRGITRDLPGPEFCAIIKRRPSRPTAQGRYRRPALLAAIQDADGRFVALEVTYLAPNARRATDLNLPRKTVGPSPGGRAVRLDPGGAAMLVGEGVFTTLSATGWFGLPGWALMSTCNLRVWSPPPGVRSVLIAADRGVDGEASADQLKSRLISGDVTATIALPPAPFGDWNEWAAGQSAPGRSKRRT